MRIKCLYDKYTKLRKGSFAMELFLLYIFFWSNDLVEVSIQYFNDGREFEQFYMTNSIREDFQGKFLIYVA